MWVDSRVGLGSTFHFTVIADVPEGEPASAADLARPLAGLRVLIVDDNTASREMIVACTQSWGMTGVAHPSLDRAVRELEEAAVDVAVVDGDLLAEASLDLGIPTVELTTLSRRDVSGRTRHERVAQVTKPVKATQLREALSRLVGRTTAAHGACEPTAALARERRPLRVLLAEDNLINQKVATKMLERLGYRADVVANGLEVLEALQRQRYDLLLLDVQMPEMDGFEAAARIKSDWPEHRRPHIVGMTALAMEGDRERCLEAGMDDYITKPVKPEELARALDRCPVASEAPPSFQGAALPTPDPRPAAVDAAVLEDLRSLQGPDEPDFVTDLIDALLAELPERLAAFDERLAAGDARGIERMAHSLKSSCGNLGALPFSKLLGQVEADAKSGALAAIGPRLAQLRGEYLRVEPALRAERRPSPSAEREDEVA